MIYTARYIRARPARAAVALLLLIAALPLSAQTLTSAWLTAPDSRMARSITPNFTSLLYADAFASDDAQLPTLRGWRLLSGERLLGASSRFRAFADDAFDVTASAVSLPTAGGLGYLSEDGLLFGASIDRRTGDDPLGLGSPAAGRAGDARYVVSLGLGYRIANGPFTITPSLNLDYTADRETALTDDDGAPSLSSSLGGQMSYRLDHGWGELEPHVRLRWIHEFDDDRPLAAFDADRPAAEDQDYLNLGLGVSARFRDGGAAFLSYEQVFGKRDVTDDDDYTVTGGVRFDF